MSPVSQYFKKMTGDGICYDIINHQCFKRLETKEGLNANLNKNPQTRSDIKKARNSKFNCNIHHFETLQMTKKLASFFHYIIYFQIR